MLAGSRYRTASAEGCGPTRRFDPGSPWAAGRAMLGASREKHHRYLINDSRTRGFNLYDGKLLGSLRLRRRRRPHRTGRGPAVQRRPYHLQDVAAPGRREGRVARVGTSGVSEAALKTAIGPGMRIKFSLLLMSSRDFGNWAQYLPASRPLVAPVQIVGETNDLLIPRFRGKTFKRLGRIPDQLGP